MSDFSCYITIDNTQNKYPLNLGNSMEDSGYWDPAPPQVIEPGTCINFRIHDPSGAYGSQAFCNYTSTNAAAQTINFSLYFSDPYSGDNTFDVESSGSGFSLNTQGLSGNCVTGNNPSDWSGARQGSVPPSGHPVSILATVQSL
jgi:hypothetical protein